MLPGAEEDGADAGRALVAIARDDEDAARDALARVDAYEADAPWRSKPFGALSKYLEASLAEIFERPRYTALDAAWTALLRVAPKRADALYGRGFARQMLRRWEEAAEDLRASLDGLPDGQMRTLAWSRLVDCLTRFDKDEALAACEAGLAEIPDDYTLNRRKKKLT